MEYIISFASAWVIAAAVFVFACKTPFFRSGIPAQLELSISTFISVLAGAIIGGAFAGAIGYGFAYSAPVDFVMNLFDLQSSLPEPFISIGFMVGAGMFAAFIFSFSRISEEMPMSSTFALVSQFSVSALAGRIVVGIFSFLFLSAYSFSVILMADILGGFVCGALAWHLGIERKAA